MVRLRNAFMVGAMAAGAFGCAHGEGSHRLPHWGYWSWVHCSECDDFPQPGYSHESMMPGSYSGPPPDSASSSRMGTPTSSNAPPMNSEAAATPSDERPVPAAPVPPDMPASPPAAPPAANP